MCRAEAIRGDCTVTEFLTVDMMATDATGTLDPEARKLFLVAAIMTCKGVGMIAAKRGMTADQWREIAPAAFQGGYALAA